MAERMRVCFRAYQNGIVAAKNNSKDSNPYSDCKRELQKWWQNGFDDQTKGLVQNDS